MAYDKQLAKKLRTELASVPGAEEKKMFGGLAFMVNGKMCINVSGNNLMCRFDPALHEEIVTRRGYIKMIMRGRELKGYCYVQPNGFQTEKEFGYWIKLCLDYNKSVINEGK